MCLRDFDWQISRTAESVPFFQVFSRAFITALFAVPGDRNIHVNATT
jgi:hypothetical protein